MITISGAQMRLRARLMCVREHCVRERSAFGSAAFESARSLLGTTGSEPIKENTDKAQNDSIPLLHN